LKPPRRVVEATEEYFEAEDALGRWLDERCVREPNAKSLTAELFNDWKQWAEPPASLSARNALLRSAHHARVREMAQRPWACAGSRALASSTRRCLPTPPTRTTDPHENHAV
jgi:hypothetical protein